MPDVTTKHGSKIPVNTAGNGGDGKIHPFQVPFEDAKGKGIGAQAQAAQILADMQAMLTERPDAKIGITYSANNDQSESIINGYKTGDCSIGGSNQGAVFTIVAAEIKKRGWNDKVHILPVSTCLHSGGADAVDDQIVKRDAQNIAQHLGAGWVVLGLQNQHLKNTPNKYSIGGGVAAKVWKGKLQASMNTALEQMTAGVETISNDLLGLKAVYQAGKQNPSALLLKQQPTATPAKPSPPTPVAQQKTPSAPQPTDLDSKDTTEPPKPANPLSKKFANVAETFPPPPKPPIIAANDINQCQWEAFKYNNNQFEFKKLNNNSSQGYLGSIVSKKDTDEPLINITKNGLECPPCSDKSEQTNAIVAGLQHMATNRNKDFNDPLIIEARGDFNVEQLQAIMKKLQEDKSPIRFQENVKNSPEIKKLITEYNSEYTKTNSPTPQPTVPPEQLPVKPPVNETTKSSKPH